MVRRGSRVQSSVMAPSFRRKRDFLSLLPFMNADIVETYERYCQYVLMMRNYTQTTADHGRRIVRIFCTETGCKTFSEVTLPIAQEYFLNGRIEKKWMPNTYIYYHKYLNVFWKWCIKHGVTDYNPFLEIEKPRLEKKIPRKLSREQAELLVSAAKNVHYRTRFQKYRNHAMIATMLFTGLRRNEILNLKAADVDLRGGVISVVQGKGKKDRLLPINFALMAILEKYVQERRDIQNDHENFFVSIQIGKPFTVRGFTRLIAALRKKTKLDFSAHTLRHTFATLMLEGGCDIYTLSKLMGHADISTTTIYLSASAQLLNKSVQKHPLGM